jgi:predicted transcriptional regulator
VNAKRGVLAYILECGPASSGDLVSTLDYATQAGAAATLLRLYRHGHLSREHDGTAYLYSITHKGRTWLSLFG